MGEEMTFDQWWETEYLKLACGQTSIKEALRAAFNAGGAGGLFMGRGPFPTRSGPSPYAREGYACIVEDGGIPLP